MKCIPTTAALICLSGAAMAQDAPLDSEAFKALVAETPYECAGYSEVTDSCETLTMITAEGDDVTAAGRSMIDETIAIEITGAGKLADGRTCMEVGGFDMSVIGVDKETSDLMAQQTKEAMAQYGDLCTTYFPQEDGSYLSLTAQRDGSAVPEGEEVVRFFAEPKDLHIGGEDL